MSIRKLSLITAISAFICHPSFAEFYLGKPRDKWGLDVTPSESSPLKLRLGTRLQTSAVHSKQADLVTGQDVTTQDFYLRRTRLQVEAKYQEGIKFYMDIRNDSVNQGDSGEGDFNVGDAYLEIGNVFGFPALKVRAFRAKVDVSRSETVSSSRILFVDRAHIADEAAQFVSHNRRASNLQLLGTFNHWSFQLVAGDGVHKSKFNDADGSSLSSGAIDGQKFMYGGKLRLYPFEGLEDKKLTETYLGKGKHFSIGQGVFHTPKIQYRNSAGTQVETIDRTLFNTELSFHYHALAFQAEYFRFDGVVENFSTAVANKGDSTGYYAQLEYVFSELSYLAPFIRYESWDRFKQKSGYTQTSSIYGLNWYLKGNNIRMAVAYQYDKFEQNLISTDGRGRRFDHEKLIKLTTMWHY